MEIKRVPISQVEPWEKNPRNIKTKDFERLKKQILELGIYKPLICYKEGDKYITLGGNMRLLALRELGVPEVEISIVHPKSEAEKIKYNLSDNDRAGEYDEQALAELVFPHIDEIKIEEFKVDLGIPVDIQFVLERYGPDLSVPKAKLKERFIIPPLSIFDTRKQYWQERKEAWRRIIGDFGQARGQAKAFGSIGRFKAVREIKRKKASVANSEVSVLDPVLAEVVLRWFNIDGGWAFDPFSGDTVFGFVAGYLGYRFKGIELRKEQVEFNSSRCEQFGLNVEYICDDGQNVRKHIEEGSMDFLFSCPPYFDLEVYSDLPNDASNQKSYDGYLRIIRKALGDSILCLKDNRFAVIVISDVRDGKGVYRNIPADIKKLFIEGGMKLYNEIILINQPVTAGLRAAKAMRTRKVIRTHQVILVFYKGEPNRIKDNFPEIDFSGIEENKDESRDL